MFHTDKHNVHSTTPSSILLTSPVMSTKTNPLPPRTRKVYSHFLINQVPPEWRRRGFASLKPLGSWTKDLRWRVRFFELWLERGNPYAFSLPAFFFPQVLYYLVQGIINGWHNERCLRAGTRITPYDNCQRETPISCF